MADVSEFITLGVGTPATIPYYLNVGLGIGSPVAASVPVTTSDYLRAMQSALQASGYFSAVTIGEPDA